MDELIPASTPVPMPADWARLHERLKRAWESRPDKGIPPPPVPLILAGAAFSSAASIRRRWSDLIDWAKAYGFESEFIAELPPPPSEDVAARIAGVSEGGGGWWNSFEMKFHEPKEKPSREDSSIALEKLLSNWLAIAGPYLGENTLPLALTGKKSRRLVVAANPSVDPPWGTWNSYAENQAAFTLFRQAVNAAIAPLEVDVVHFLTHKWVSRQQ